MNTLPRFFITPGEPAGIGPDITLQLIQKAWPAELIIVADPTLLAARAKQLQLPIAYEQWDEKKAVSPHTAGKLLVLPVTLATPVQAGKLNPAHADYVLRTLSMAGAYAMSKKVAGIVTGPVHKGILNAAGFNFSGHTEFFAATANHVKTVMLFVVDQLKVALLTTHLPLSAVPAAITKPAIQQTIAILQHHLQEDFKIKQPKIAVCGLNPHAGENGYLGREEIDIITPALDELRREGYQLIGPLSADTIFLPAVAQQADAILAMYHDQALPVVKQLGFERAVNVTLGLPFIRTSVDHGTALELAGTGKASASSMEAALQLAIELVSNVGNITN